MTLRQSVMRRPFVARAAAGIGRFADAARQALAWASVTLAMRWSSSHAATAALSSAAMRAATSIRSSASLTTITLPLAK